MLISKRRLHTGYLLCNGQDGLIQIYKLSYSLCEKSDVFLPAQQYVNILIKEGRMMQQVEMFL